jgi:translocator protein
MMTTITSPTRPSHHGFAPGKLVLTLGASLLVISVGALFPPDAWFVALNKPAWNPPNWLFAPVWTTLYALMAIAAWRVWRLPSTQSRNRALTFYVVQLFLNAMWTPLFFGAHSLAGALADILLLDVMVAATIVLFSRLDRPAAWLMAPYMAWISFATALNAAIWWLNR